MKAQSNELGQKRNKKGLYKIHCTLLSCQSSAAVAGISSPEMVLQFEKGQVEAQTPFRCPPSRKHCLPRSS